MKCGSVTVLVQIFSRTFLRPSTLWNKACKRPDIIMFGPLAPATRAHDHVSKDQEAACNPPPPCHACVHECYISPATPRSPVVVKPKRCCKKIQYCFTIKRHHPHFTYKGWGMPEQKRTKVSGYVSAVVCDSPHCGRPNPGGCGLRHAGGHLVSPG